MLYPLDGVGALPWLSDLVNELVADKLGKGREYLDDEGVGC